MFAYRNNCIMHFMVVRNTGRTKGSQREQVMRQLSVAYLDAGITPSELAARATAGG